MENTEEKKSPAARANWHINREDGESTVAAGPQDTPFLHGRTAVASSDFEKFAMPNATDKPKEKAK